MDDFKDTATGIDLLSCTKEHFDRLTDLADEAAANREETYSSRASAMNVLSKAIDSLVKTQAEIINIGRIQKAEKALVDTIRQSMPEKNFQEFLRRFKLALEQNAND